MGEEQAIVRPVRAADLGAVLQLARRGGNGLTNLPPDPATLERRIAAAESALLDEAARLAGAPVMLVAELEGDIVAIGMIFARVGAEWPFYSYRITRQAAVSRTLARSRPQRLLNLTNDFDGETEVGGLFVDPERRGLALGQLMARARYMFIATHRDWFGERVIAELRGYQNQAGRSPVWDAIGRHFYDMEFDEADRTGAIFGNQFIADLGPRYPIYVSMLPTAAQEALGRPHDDGRPALAMLLAEGFRDEGYVDIFDGGPTLVSPIDSVRTVAACRSLRYAENGGDEAALIACGSGPAFRLARGRAQALADGDARLDAAVADALHIQTGDSISLAPYGVSGNERCAALSPARACPGDPIAPARRARPARGAARTLTAAMWIRRPVQRHCRLYRPDYRRNLDGARRRLYLRYVRRELHDLFFVRDRSFGRGGRRLDRRHPQRLSRWRNPPSRRRLEWRRERGILYLPPRSQPIDQCRSHAVGSGNRAPHFDPLCRRLHKPREPYPHRMAGPRQRRRSAPARLRSACHRPHRSGEWNGGDFRRLTADAA
ncbi:hypothetical protein GKE62_07920 [Novosphingobium sp. Gsoil 351]|nr:hypothetical protein GKE62_07920 [Novosphingobium sp. Gsoil 351]